jgi:crossover junction endodeoxyribonuclease RuvC
MKIVGIDLSLTGTGLASIVDGVPQTKAVVSKGEQADPLEQRFDRQSTITNHILDFALGPAGAGFIRSEIPDLVVIESLFNSSTFAGSLIDRAGLWWRIVGSLLAWDVPVVHATPGQGKMFLTGAGNADKGAMAMYFSKIFPGWEPTTKKNANDEADAGALASIGWALVMPPSAWPFEPTQYRKKVVDDLRKKQNLVKEPA